MSEAATKPDIVVGVDGSDESFAALKWALEEASLTGQSVNAVFGWTHSWDMGSEPDSDEAWAKVRHDIANELRVWVDKAAAGIDFDPANLKLTSVKASGTSALLQIGHDSQQIVVGLGQRSGQGPHEPAGHTPLAEPYGPLVHGVPVRFAGRGRRSAGDRGAHRRQRG